VTEARKTAAPPANGGASDTVQELGRQRFLRRRTWFCRLAAVPFLTGCAGVVVLLALYNWPSMNVPVYYFTVRPAMVWFAMLAPLFVPGLFAVRLKWFACGLLLWAVGLARTEELFQCVPLPGGSARERFADAQLGFRSYIEHGGAQQQGSLNVPLRIATWNVHEGRDGAREAVAQLAALEPDVVLMQEFGPGRKVTMTEAIETSDAFEGYSLDGDRQAILSRYPVERLPNGPLPGRLGSVWCVTVAPGAELLVLNVHLSRTELRTQLVRWITWHWLQEAVERTRSELDAVESALEGSSRDDTVILAGDFNLPPHYADLRRATRGWTDCFREAGRGWGKTAPARLPLVRIDMLFVPVGSEVYYAAAVPTQFSDHYMTLAEVVVPVQARRRPAAPAADALASDPLRE